MACGVFIADDVASIRELWRAVLESDPRIQVVGEAADGDEAVRGVTKARPHVLLLDLAMPGRDGLECIPLVRKASPETSIVIASGFAEARMGQAAFDLGAVAYFEKGRPADDLLRVVLAAFEHSRWERPEAGA